MNKEIKEIFKKYSALFDINVVGEKTVADFNELKDYITNLQEYNERQTKYIAELLIKITNLEELCNKYEEEHNTTFKEWQQDILINKATIEDIEFYKSRIDKAIDYIKKHTIMVESLNCVEINDLLNILQDKNDE